MVATRAGIAANYRKSPHQQEIINLAHNLVPIEITKEKTEVNTAIFQIQRLIARNRMTIKEAKPTLEALNDRLYEIEEIENVLIQKGFDEKDL